MQLSRTDEQQTLFERFALLGEKIAVLLQRDERAFTLNKDAWEQLSQEGFWRLPVPRTFGGHGGDWWDFVAAFEGLSTTTRDLGFLLSIVAHVGGIRVILEFGSEAQKHKYLPILVGGAVASTAITEPGGGSDVARVTTTAVRFGDKLVLKGQKAHITNAPVADLFVIVGRHAELKPKRDICLFIIERNDGCVRTDPPENMLGNPSSPTGDIHLDGVPLNETSILGTPGDGLNVLYNMISLDRLLYGLIAAAFFEPFLQEAWQRSSTREAFNRPIKEFQYVQQRLVDMKLQMETSRYLAYAALDKLINNDPYASFLCSAAKYVGTEGLWLNSQHAMLLHGHQGYMAGELSNLLKDCAGTRIAGGTSDIQKVNMFNQMNRLFNQEEECNDEDRIKRVA